VLCVSDSALYSIRSGILNHGGAMSMYVSVSLSVSVSLCLYMYIGYIQCMHMHSLLSQPSDKHIPSIEIRRMFYSIGLL